MRSGKRKEWKLICSVLLGFYLFSMVRLHLLFFLSIIHDISFLQFLSFRTLLTRDKNVHLFLSPFSENNSLSLYISFFLYRFSLISHFLDSLSLSLLFFSLPSSPWLSFLKQNFSTYSFLSVSCSICFICITLYLFLFLQAFSRKLLTSSSAWSFNFLFFSIKENTSELLRNTFEHSVNRL